MKIITAKELTQILENHRHWLNKDCAGWENMRASLSGAFLSGASLSGASLSGASLSGASLRDAFLSGASLSGASLSGASLSGASLRDADLSGADLSGASLRDADLSGADLSGASLRDADLRIAKIDWGTKIHVPYACPETGSFIGWKKASNEIVCLEIQEDALRSSATSRKCRCSKAKVLNITNLNGAETDLTEVASDFDKNFIYRVGEVAEVKDFDTDRWNESSTGIHFFITRQEAVEY